MLAMLKESNVTCDIQLLKGGIYWSVQRDNEDAEANSVHLLSATTDLSESVLRLHPKQNSVSGMGNKR
jgi:hypothetical protein